MRSRRSLEKWPGHPAPRGRLALQAITALALVAGCLAHEPATTDPAVPGGGVPTTFVVSRDGSSVVATDVPRIAWEGGPTYYDKFAQMRAAGWTDPAFFPIGSWFEAVTSPVFFND